MPLALVILLSLLLGIVFASLSGTRGDPEAQSTGSASSRPRSRSASPPPTPAAAPRAPQGPSLPS